MRKLFRWLLIVLGSVLGLAVLVLAAINVHMGQRIDAVYMTPPVALAVPGDDASIVEGGRLARLRGCNGGCHGKTSEGGIFFEMFDGTRVVAPDLGRVAQDYSTVELERAIRHGIRQDGTSVIGVMPSEMLYDLSDADLGAIIAFLKSQPPGSEALPGRRLGPAVLAMLFYFSHKFDWNVLAAEGIDHDAPRIDADNDDPLARGEYLAMTSCRECHASDLRGTPGNNVPSLAIVAAYTQEDFRTLMRTGVPIGGRELDLMAAMSINRFTHFTDAEIDGLHAYLQTLAASE